MKATADEPHLRADARRNRDALLAAATEVFAEDGLDAPLCEIARRAGVGQGTLYRRFASRQALLEAIADNHLAELSEVVAQAGARPDAFLTFFRAAVRLGSQDQGLIGLLIARSLPEPSLVERGHAFVDIFSALLRRAQDAGLVRGDLEPEDVRLLLQMIGAGSRGVDPEADRARALELALDVMGPRR